MKLTFSKFRMWSEVLMISLLVGHGNGRVFDLYPEVVSQGMSTPWLNCHGSSNVHLGLRIPSVVNSSHVRISCRVMYGMAELPGFDHCCLVFSSE